MSWCRRRSVLVRPAESAAAKANWERIFGSDEEIMARRKAAIAAQKRQERKAARAAAESKARPHTIGDSHKPYYSSALDMTIESRSQMKAELATHYARTGVRLRQA